MKTTWNKNVNSRYFVGIFGINLLSPISQSDFMIMCWTIFGGIHVSDIEKDIEFTDLLIKKDVQLSLHE